MTENQGTSANYVDWINQYANAAYALAYSRVGGYHYTQDIAQETFLKAYLNRHDVKDLSKVGRWLYTITVRTSADWSRANRVKSVVLKKAVLPRHCNRDG